MDGSALISARSELERLRGVAAALTAALAHSESETRAAARQDGLDLLAVVVRLKPMCIFGRGARDEAWLEAVSAIAAREGLFAIAAAPWDADCSAADLPEWYLDAAAQRWTARSVLYVCRDAATIVNVAALSAAGRVTVADEAALLAYPPCCVAQHHAQAIAYEGFLAALSLRAARGDPLRAGRMIAAGAEPLPGSRQEWARYASLTAIAPSDFTSVNMCHACAADPDSPARRLSRRYETLAASAHYSLR